MKVKPTRTRLRKRFSGYMISLPLYRPSVKVAFTILRQIHLVDGIEPHQAMGYTGTSELTHGVAFGGHTDLSERWWPCR